MPPTVGLFCAGGDTMIHLPASRSETLRGICRRIPILRNQPVVAVRSRRPSSPLVVAAAAKPSPAGRDSEGGMKKPAMNGTGGGAEARELAGTEGAVVDNIEPKTLSSVPLKAPTVLPQHAFEGVHCLKKGILTVTCSDSAGIIGTVTSFLHMHGANIEDCATNSTPGSVFVMRVEFSLPDHWLGVVREAFAVMIAEPYQMQWALKFEDEHKKIAILCTKEDHALMEMLWAVMRKDLKCTVTVVISNHTDLQQPTEALGFKYHHVPVEQGKKSEAEEEMFQLLQGADLVVLARYMQVLSEDIIDRLKVPIINIHHSFLPAFKGANPYRQAHQKGVRLIGATAHYVTAELDQGPIIEQDVVRVNHRMSVKDFQAMGRSVECKVLHRAVKWHLEDRVFLVEGNKTVVFS